MQMKARALETWKVFAAPVQAVERRLWDGHIAGSVVVRLVDEVLQPLFDAKMRLSSVAACTSQLCGRLARLSMHECLHVQLA